MGDPRQPSTRSRPAPVSDPVPNGGSVPEPRPAWLGRLAWGWAVAGGGLLCLLALMTTLSIVGRVLGGLWPGGPFGPLPGDYEVLELGVGIAVFSVLPWCHWRGGNVAVDLVARVLPPALVGAAGRLGEALFAVLVGLIAVQLAAGAADLSGFGETSMVLRLPVAWAYWPAIASSLLWLAVILARLLTVPAGRR